MKIAVGILIVLYIVGVIAMWRISTFLCMKCRWLSFVPIVQLVYFASMSDHVSCEVKEGFKYCSCLLAVFIGMVGIGFLVMNLMHYDATILGGRLMVSLCSVASILTLIYSFVNIVVNSTEHSIIACLSTVVIPFPIVLLIASFMMPTYMEETLMLYTEE